MTPGPLVGRDAESRVLGEAIRRAASGRAQVAAICGEAGIGKSRLAREALRSAGTGGFRTLESAAGRLHRDLSYAPIVEALRPLVAEAALTRGLSDLARLFDGLPVPPLVALGDPGLERTRMFEAVRRLVERASTRSPLAIFIDDLHWADPGTVALLHYIARALPGQRCLLLVAYRADEASAELQELVTALQRAEMLTVVELTGLDATAIGDLAAVVLGGPVPASLQEMLVRRSGGVPLFVRAIVLRLIETGALFSSVGRWVLRPGAAAEVPALVSTLLRAKMVRVTRSTAPTLWACSLRQPGRVLRAGPERRRARAPVPAWTSRVTWAAARWQTSLPKPVPRRVSWPAGSRRH